MANIKEPYARVTERVVQATTLRSVDGTSIMAGAIKAPYGPEWAYTTSSSEFLKVWNNGMMPNGTEDTTFLNAYFCSQFAPLYIRRVVNASARYIGLDLSSSAIYQDGNHEVTASVANLGIILKNKADYNGVKGIVVNVEKQDDTAGLYKDLHFYKLTVSGMSENPMTIMVSSEIDEEDPITGKNAFIENVINMNDYPFICKYVEMPADGDYAFSDHWHEGDTQLVNNANIAPTDWKAAIEMLAEQEEFDLDYLNCFGALAHRADYEELVSKEDGLPWAFFPHDIDVDYAQIEGDAYQNECSRVINLYPADLRTDVCRLLTKVYPASLYYQRVYANKANNEEFAPVFSTTNGRLTYMNPTHELKKGEREALLNATKPVNSVKWYPRVRSYAFNNNLVCRTAMDVMSEEMNVRMANKIARGILQIVPDFHGRLNNKQLRKEVVENLNYFMDENIMSQNYRPVEYLVICNDKNNTDAVINANKLAIKVCIRLQGSIKYIDVLDEIYPLGVDFGD